ncbi:hypothetical protein QJS04_geneDACA008683 [Acorus gramineus]|uniref:Myb-like domain-containing protein n=1 Tax=Acorus gramineus TaxID=55184 RepID=A0AAV9AE10_ACOGR|nr:hypothetical protein QJS04_geneDACA008683 [Acorus gramineus]
MSASSSSPSSLQAPLPPPPPPKPPSSRRPPPPCWAHEETLALIESYRDKWNSLRRGNLRAADWQSVADSVADRCGQDPPSKTATQCRHKVEKLRKRYRAEKRKNNTRSIHHLMSNGSGGGGGLRFKIPTALRSKRMKMESAKEMEKRRMEMELKRTELILKSYRNIVDSVRSGSSGDRKRARSETRHSSPET